MGGRGLIRLKYVHAYTDRHGTRRHYFRRYGSKTTLPGLPGSEEFMEAYGALLAGQRLPKAAVRLPAAPGTFAALATLYYNTGKYRALAPSSRVNYRRVIDHFLEEHGHRLVRQMTRERVEIVIGMKADFPGAAQILLKRLRTLTRFALKLGWVKADPTAGVESFKSVEFQTWTEEEITTYQAFWAPGTRQRLAFALLLYTGQRGSDAHRMAWPDIAGEAIRVRQQKTGTELEIPLHPALKDELRSAPRRHVVILTTEYGAPFSPKGFQNLVSAAIKAAGLPEHCKAHGLRKAAARRLAEAGASANQIASITGHKTLAEVERYTRAADQKMLAQQAMAKQVANEPVATPAEPVAKSKKKVSDING